MPHTLLTRIVKVDFSYKLPSRLSRTGRQRRPGATGNACGGGYRLVGQLTLRLLSCSCTSVRPSAVPPARSGDGWTAAATFQRISGPHRKFDRSWKSVKLTRHVRLKRNRLAADLGYKYRTICSRSYGVKDQSKKWSGPMRREMVTFSASTGGYEPKTPSPSFHQKSPGPNPTLAVM